MKSMQPNLNKMKPANQSYNKKKQTYTGTKGEHRKKDKKNMN